MPLNYQYVWLVLLQNPNMFFSFFFLCFLHIYTHEKSNKRTEQNEERKANDNDLFSRHYLCRCLTTTIQRTKNENEKKKRERERERERKGIRNSVLQETEKKRKQIFNCMLLARVLFRNSFRSLLKEDMHTCLYKR